MTQSRLVGGRYELGELIGYGGMAEVHVGHDVRLGREVAIKVLRSDLARDPTFQARFRREAQAAAGLNHPAIVAVYDTGEDAGPDGPIPFIVMEYVHGRTLRDILKVEGHLPPHRAMEITADVAGALDFSHRNGIVHRDIKPANVMITNNGAVKVMDFGIARAVADNAATVTQTAAVIGTAQYLSPEQARGETVDARSDVYSTGCLLYELITGHPPFTGDSPVAVAYQHVRENPAVPSSVNPEVPHALDSIVMKSLAKNPLNRYQSAGEMRADLLRALASRPVEAELVYTDDDRTQMISSGAPTGAVGAADDEVEDGHGKRTAIIWIAVILALLLVIGGAAWALLRNNNDKGPAAPATVAVPDLTGMTVQQAQDTLRGKNLTPDAAKPKQDSGPCGPSGLTSMPEGRVCNQTPNPNVTVNEGQKVTFTVYTTGTIPVPSVQGQNWNTAQAQVTQAGLVPVRKDVNNAQPQGTVVGVSPDPGTPVKKGSNVTLSVSTGQLQVPDVTGLSFNEARVKLNQQGFQNVQQQLQEVEDPAAVGKVFSENPGQGSVVPPNTTITLLVGKQKAQQVPPVTGQKFTDAQKQLQQLGFKVQEQDQPVTDPTQDNVVIGQNPAAGSTAQPGDTIVLTVGKLTQATTPATSPPCTTGPGTPTCPPGG